MTVNTGGGSPDRVIQFDMYAAPPPKGEWGYTLDQYGIIYRRGLIAQRLRPGWWPFAYADADHEHHARRGTVPPVPVECGAAPVRLAPDCAVRSWGNEYVTVTPSRTMPHHAAATLTLWVRPQGAGGMVTRCRVHFDLLATTHHIQHLHPALPEEVSTQAQVKAAKLTAYLAAEIKYRDDGPRRPATADDRQHQRRHRPGQWQEPDPRNGSPGWSRDVGDGTRWLFACPAGGRWRWAVCQYDESRPLVTGQAADALEAMALADAAGRLPQTR
ncbi:hypothetical protein AGRA3207_007498 [Actinomadura graeca]|uniref:Uncharacterized protein n=1 Tax=Actinomadura graeca TaxID=2750812 RepID=A0ABX8R6P2_9ACTN|nr:hypothetical protein [Actinomadura graeca]QXJ25929.1 hypothetical protein AGRA3207_007498 [Actinomadura graeca]